MPKTNTDTGRIRLGETALRTGIRLHYAEKTGGNERDPIVFLHGYADSWRSFEPVLAALPAERRAFALDQRGHGGSGKPQGRYAVVDFAEDLLLFMDAAGLKKAHVVGHSMGSIVAQLFAVLHPDRVNKLVLVSSASSPSQNAVLRDFMSVAQGLRDPLDRAFVRDFQATSNPVPADFMETIVSESMKTPAHVWRAALDGMLQADHRQILSKVSAPTLIAWGNQDEIFTWKDQEEILRRIPNAVLREYETGHGLHWEKPQEFAADLERFVG